MFNKTTTFRLDVPLNPNDTRKIKQNEHEKLLKNQKKYVSNLLKQNFNKFRVDKSLRAESQITSVGGTPAFSGFASQID